MSAGVEEGGAEEEPDVTTLGDLKRRLEDIMSRPKATARDAEEAAEAARALADLLRGEERALRVLGAAQTELHDGGPTGPRSGGLPLAGLTLHEAARRVLERWGWPMHVSELGVRIKAGGWRHPRARHPSPDQIQYQLAARLPRHPETFRKFGPNTFGLAEWGDSPPRREAPRPRLGIPSGGEPYEGPSARWLAEHPEAWYDDMVKDDRG
jgi:hypothetical protein